MRGRRHKLQVSTFPFLAVLLCAMGSLILILLVMDRKAHRAAVARAQRQAAKLVEDSARNDAERERMRQQARMEQERKRETLHAKLTNEQIEMQLQMRKVRDQLQQIAARLHYEQDTSTELRRKVQDERSRLQADEQLLATLHSNADRTENQAKESSGTLRRMTIDLLRMEQALKDLKAAQKREQKTFSVVPYHGRRGENRRPFYVECSTEGVVFHPERKAMPVVSLLPGARDPANDVRAEVERRIARQRAKLAGLPNNKDDTPYLLLLLRPGGVNTYHLFQAALKGLDLEFGYEFIDDDWVLDFPADDEMPSAQPWMIASKAPARSTPAPVAPTSPRPIAHPIATTLGGTPGGVFAGGVRGLRSNEPAGFAAGPSQNPATNPAGSSVAGAGGGTGGAGMPGGGGAGGMGSFAPSMVAYSGKRGGFVGGGNGAGGGPGVAEGMGGGGPGVGGGTGGSGGGPFAGSASAPSNSFSPNSLSPAGGDGSNTLPLFPGGGNGVGGEGGGIGIGMRGGGRRGHPSAMPPSVGDGDGQDGYSGENRPLGGNFRVMGPYTPGGTGSGMGYGAGSSMDGSSGGGGSDAPGLGPPRALSSGSPGGGVGGGNGVTGVGSPGNGIPGSGTASGGSSVVGGSGSSSAGNSGEGGSVIARADNGGNGSAQGSDYGGTVGPASRAGPSDAARLAASTSGGGTDGSVGPASRAGPSDAARLAASTSGGGTDGSVGPSSRAGPSDAARLAPSTSGGSSSGSPDNLGGGSGSPQAGGAAANGSGSSDRVIYLDPLTGKPTTPPAAPSADAAPQERPTAEAPGNRGPQRVRVVVGNGGAGGEPGDPQAQEMNRFAPTPTTAAPPRRPVVPRPAWVHGGRDWTIYIECRNEAVLLYPSQRTFALAESIRAPADNPLINTIQQMIDRRQSSRGPGEPPYHPQLCLLVRPEHIRTFLTLYPALEALPVPKTRRNLDDDDDVIGIVTGSIP